MRARIAVLMLILGTLAIGCGSDNHVGPVGGLLIGDLDGSDSNSVGTLDSSRLYVIATGFAMPSQTYHLSNVTLKLRWPVDPNRLVVQVANDSSGGPGHALATLVFRSGSASIFSTGLFTWAPRQSLTLNGGSTYWVMAYNTGPRTDFGILGTLWPGWMDADSAQVPTGIATHVGTRVGTTMPYPPRSATPAVFQYAVYASRG